MFISSTRGSKFNSPAGEDGWEKGNHQQVILFTLYKLGLKQPLTEIHPSPKKTWRWGGGKEERDAFSLSIAPLAAFLSFFFLVRPRVSTEENPAL